MIGHSRKLPRVLVVDGDPTYALGGSFYRGLVERGYDAHYFDESFWARNSARGSDSLSARLGRRALRLVSVPLMNVALITRATALRPDVIVICKGYYVEPKTVTALQRVAKAVAVYHSDDLQNPLNTHARMLESLPKWDLVCTPRHFAVEEMRQAGARRAVHVPFGYDPHIFHPAPQSARTEELASAVSFIGAYAPERAAMLEHLAQDGAPLRVYGHAWYRMGVSPALEKCVQGRGVYGDQLRAVMTHSAINVNFLRHGNRDLHVMRTFELPACGGFVLAERTSEHLSFFDEGTEAAYFQGPEELVEKVRYYLARPEERARIARAGHERLLRDRHTYADRIDRIVRLSLGEDAEAHAR